MDSVYLKVFVIVMACLLTFELVVASEEEDHYKTLGVEKTASLKQIKKAYKQLALKYHPDKVRDKKKKKQSEEKFFKINQAYEILSSPEKRKLYDMQKSGNPNPFTSGFGGQHFGGQAGNDFGFESMFFENHGRQRPFHFASDFQGGNFFSFDNIFPEDHHPFFEDHTFGDGSSFFGSHFGSHANHHHENHYSQHSRAGHHGHHQAQGSHSHSHFNHMNQDHRSCKTVTQRVGNVVTTFMQCS